MTPAPNSPRRRITAKWTLVIVLMAATWAAMAYAIYALVSGAQL